MIVSLLLTLKPGVVDAPLYLYKMRCCFCRRWRFAAVMLGSIIPGKLPVNVSTSTPIALTSDTRLKGVAVPTLKEHGIKVVLGNWRGVYGAPGIMPAQRKKLTDLVLKAIKNKSWLDASEKKNGQPLC